MRRKVVSTHVLTILVKDDHLSKKYKTRIALFIKDVNFFILIIDFRPFAISSQYATKTHTMTMWKVIIKSGSNLVDLDSLTVPRIVTKKHCTKLSTLILSQLPCVLEKLLSS